MEEMKYLYCDDGEFENSTLYIPVPDKNLKLIEKDKLLNDYEPDGIIHYDEELIDVYEFTSKSIFKIELNHRFEKIELTEEQKEISDDLCNFFHNGKIDLKDDFEMRKLFELYELKQKYNEYR